MASPLASRSDGLVIADQFLVERNRVLPSVGGLQAFGAADQSSSRTDLMAVQIQRQFPARARAFQVLTTPIEGLLTPVAYGEAGDSCYAICLAPPAPNLLARLRPWSEAELIECVLRPVARMLEALNDRGITHRGIRLDNVYQIAPGQPVVLGAAWFAPPAMAQPALFEPPYSAICLPTGRGEGSIADDVYALGVLLLCLVLGRAPLASLDEAAIIRRKLVMGTYAALAGEERLPPIIGDLVRGMLAEDPEHRPTPTLLLDPASARGRRVAARPPRRAQHAIALAGGEIWDARSLAHAMAIEPEQGLHALRSGTVEHWLRRGLGDGALAARVEELVRHRNLDGMPEDPSSEAALVMRAITLLDPLAPLCWRGIAFWPDGLGAMLASALGTNPDVMMRLEEVLLHEEMVGWSALRADRSDFAMLRVEARQHRAWLQQRGPAGGMVRLSYLLNPLMPCASPLLAGQWVARLADLLPALQEVAGRVDHKKTEPVDSHIAAFVSARLERRVDNNLTPEGKLSEEASCLGQLRVLAHLQGRSRAQALPALAGWLADRSAPVLATWRNRARRAAVAERLNALVSVGQLAPMLAVLENPAGRAADAREAMEAADQLGRIDAELRSIAGGSSQRSLSAYRLGQEIAAGFGLVALATVLAVAALG